MKKYDLIVVGGGILGTFYAYHALMQGKSVAILEKGSLPQGSSVQNFGQVVPSGMDAKWQRYGRKSLEIYKSIQAQFDISVRQNGSIYVASNEEEMTLLEELAVINAANDYPSHLLTKSACLDRYEGLRADYCVGGLFFPEEVTVEPRIALYRIQAYLKEQKGLDLFTRTLVVSIEKTGNGCLVESSDNRTFHADRVLVCSGYEFMTLYPEIFAASDIEAVKLQMILLEKQPTQVIPGSILTGLSIRRYESFRECPSYQSIKSKEDPQSFARRWGVHILFKQATDGSIILGDSHEYADVKEADMLFSPIKESVNQFMLEEGAKIFDLQNWNVRETWSGMYSQCKSNDLFRHTIDGSIEIVTGIGGKGMTGSAGMTFFSNEH